MRTPMQEMLEYVQDEVQLFGSARQILISKIKEMLEKEQQVMCEFAIDYTMQAKTAYDFHRAKFNNEL